jgi:hypothetical protein
MENYIKIPINNNIDNIINFNLKLDLIKNTMLNNKNIKFELYDNEISNEILIKNKKRNKENFNNISFYIKVSDNISVGNNSIVDLNCNICYEIKMPNNFKRLRCNHKLCNSCYEKWCNINVSCPYCRAVIS